MTAQLKALFDEQTATFTYIVYDEDGGSAAVIDAVLNYDQRSGRTRTTSDETVIEFLRTHRLTLEWILESHAHADHLSGAAHLKQTLGGKLGVGAQIRIVQRTFKELLHLEPTLAVDGSQFDRLFDDGDTFTIGKLHGTALAVPGHTPACMAYLIEDMLFVGDTLFMPDVGTARCDFPGGDPRVLYASIRRLLALPMTTRIMVCHDYPPAGREPQHETSVGAQRAHNIHVHDGISEETFVNMRRARDATLDLPVLIIPAIQVNIRAGALPPPEADGSRSLKIPLNVL